jgi:hypothetical protein
VLFGGFFLVELWSGAIAVSPASVVYVPARTVPPAIVALLPGFVSV